MNGEEKRGCLWAILRLFGLADHGVTKSLPPPYRVDQLDDGDPADADDAAQSLPPPYRVRDDFLSPAEAGFFQTLRDAAPEGAYICPKVRVGDVLFVPKGHGISWRNKIDSKHVDFLLCDERTSRSLLAIELDDASHDRDDRRERDAFVDAAFAAAGLPLLRIRARAGYEAAELNRRIGDALRGIERKSPVPPPLASRSAPPSGAPLCPKCDVPMVERVSRRGSG